MLSGLGLQTWKDPKTGLAPSGDILKAAVYRDANPSEPGQSSPDTLVSLVNNISNMNDRGPINEAYLGNLITDNDFRNLTSLYDTARDPANSRWLDYAASAFNARYGGAAPDAETRGLGDAETNGPAQGYGDAAGQDAATVGQPISPSIPSSAGLFPSFMMDLDDAVRGQDLKPTQIRDLTNKMLDDVGNLIPAWAPTTPAEAAEPPPATSPPPAGAALAPTSGSPEGTVTKNPDDANTGNNNADSNVSGSKEGDKFYLDRGWNEVKDKRLWWKPEAAAEIPISREELIDKLQNMYPQYGDKITNSPEEIINGKPNDVYGNPIDAAMASGCYMQHNTKNNEEQATLIYPARDGNGFVFVEPSTREQKGESVPADSREKWDKIDPNTRYNDVVQAHTHGVKNTTEGSMHFSPGDYGDMESGKIEYMINSRGEHRFFFPGSGDDHVYVIDKLP